jgi:hypothetical protein
MSVVLRIETINHNTEGEREVQQVTDEDLRDMIDNMGAFLDAEDYMDPMDRMADEAVLSIMSELMAWRARYPAIRIDLKEPMQ